MSKQQSPEQPKPHSTLAEIWATLLVKVVKLRELGLNPCADSWVATHQTAALQLEYADLASSEVKAQDVDEDFLTALPSRRSEERRVGKEC